MCYSFWNAPWRCSLRRPVAFRSALPKRTTTVFWPNCSTAKRYGRRKPNILHWNNNVTRKFRFNYRFTWIWWFWRHAIRPNCCMLCARLCGTWHDDMVATTTKRAPTCNSKKCNQRTMFGQKLKTRRERDFQSIVIYLILLYNPFSIYLNICILYWHITTHLHKHTSSACQDSNILRNIYVYNMWCLHSLKHSQCKCYNGTNTNNKHNNNFYVHFVFRLVTRVTHSQHISYLPPSPILVINIAHNDWKSRFCAQLPNNNNHNNKEPNFRNRAPHPTTKKIMQIELNAKWRTTTKSMMDIGSYA